MEEITSTVVFENLAIEFKHVESRVQNDKSLIGKIYISNPEEEINTLTTMNIHSKNSEITNIYFQWQSSSIDGFAIVYVPETNVIFGGGGKTSFSFSLKQNKIISETYSWRFWTLKRIDDHIVELGELDCYLYNLEGHKIAQCPVDPPYEYELTNKGIRFKSEVHGITWLRY